MKNLIIGAGNMGLRHAEILTGLHQVVELVDLEFDPTTYKWAKYQPDSVLVCTPAETHADIINNIPPDIPVFCEKPLLVDLKQEIKRRDGPTLMACNWLFCSCAQKAKYIHCTYQSSDKYRLLDILHFYPFHPNMEIVRTRDQAIGLSYRPIRKEEFYARITFWENQNFTVADGKSIHVNGPCDMFNQQMKHWLNVIQQKEKSRLPFEKALEYNRELLEKLR